MLSGLTIDRMRLGSGQVGQGHKQQKPHVALHEKSVGGQKDSARLKDLLM